MRRGCASNELARRGPGALRASRHARLITVVFFVPFVLSVLPIFPSSVGDTVATYEPIDIHIRCTSSRKRTALSL
jgi:hypothetical protein